jgi:flagellar basal-body rod protein FlgG
MERALRAAATGMSAQQLNVDVISNNIANVNTTGFKKSMVEFKDLVYQKIKSGHGAGESGQTLPVEVQVGNGVKYVSTSKVFMQGALTQTANPLDIAINGDGFLKVQLPSGEVAYTRDGQIKIDAEGKVVTATGNYFLPEITVPEDTEEIVFRQDGRVEVKLLGEREFTEIGQLELSRFINPTGLSSIGNNLYIETESSGPPIDGTPALDGFGSLEQGYIEQSNVDLVNEMVAMISAQRAYEVNSKTVQSVDQMYDIANGIKR